MINEKPNEQKSPEERLQEVWEVIADLKEDKMAEASRTALELQMKGEITFEEYGAVCFYLGTRAGATANWILHEKLSGGEKPREEGDDRIDMEKPIEYWQALQGQLSTLSQTLEQRAWEIQDNLKKEGKTIFSHGVPENK